MNDIFVIVRSSKERSLPLVIDALKQQTKNYTIIEEAPFSAALKKMFSIAKDTPFPYLLALDADVILHPGILDKIQDEVKAHLKKVPGLFFLDFFVMDKFRGKCCSGCHLYINRYSKDLLDHPIENFDETRPENHLVLDFAKKFHLSHKTSPLAVGLHDFEQYYKDLYAKYFRRSIRRPNEAEMLLHIIQARRLFFPNDLDFDVVLKAFQDGLQAEKPSFLFDARQYAAIETMMPIKEKLLIR